MTNKKGMSKREEGSSSSSEELPELGESLT